MFSLSQKLQCHLQNLYGDSLQPKELEELEQRILKAMGLSRDTSSPIPYTNHWDQQDSILITYGDSIVGSKDSSPLDLLTSFLQKCCSNICNGVHILPFFPYSSDDGFSVIDYLEVNPELGSWREIEAIGSRFRLMADLVLNHCSSKSLWFENFITQRGVGSDYIMTAEVEDDLSLVVRPRTSPLLRKTQTADGAKYVWCTFSHDQVDLDFRNPAVLLAFVEIIRFYLDRGISLFRLDAVAFLWKEPGTCCINLPQTHEVVRLLRCLIEHSCPDGVVITETNIPNRENLSYFGEADEANWIYNFSLPPLLLHTLISGSSYRLRRWQMRMPPARNGTAYFNFIASHDGIGLRPVETILNAEETQQLVETMMSFGGLISWRESGEGKKPYEINISLIDALRGSVNGPDSLAYERFLCAHCIMLALEGIPGIYIHSLLGSNNDYKKVEREGHNRAINRHQWQEADLYSELTNPDSSHYKVFRGLSHLLEIRADQPAFHPNATQFTLNLDDVYFGLWRQSIDRTQSIFSISNITSQDQEFDLGQINLIDYQDWYDLISGSCLLADREQIILTPYQTIWLTNRKTVDSFLQKE